MSFYKMHGLDEALVVAFSLFTVLPHIDILLNYFVFLSVMVVLPSFDILLNYCFSLP